MAHFQALMQRIALRGHPNTVRLSSNPGRPALPVIRGPGTAGSGKVRWLGATTRLMMRRLLNKNCDNGRGVKFVLLLLLAVASAWPAWSQGEKKGSDLRIVHGMVVDKNENPVSTSVVYLKNLRTSGVKTYISDEGGKFRFSGLDPNADYEIYAEFQGDCSPTRTISSFDSRRDIDITLKLTRKCGK